MNTYMQGLNLYHSDTAYKHSNERIKDMIVLYVFFTSNNTEIMASSSLVFIYTG